MKASKGLVFSVLIIGVPAWAEPLSISNQSPAAALLGIAPAQSAQLLDKGQWRIAVNTSISSHYIARQGGNEALLLDGETAELKLQLRYGLAEHWQLDFNLPYRHHSGGSLDGLVNDWHDFFGFSDGGRAEDVSDRVAYRYRLNGIDQVNFTENSNGIADPQLGLNYRFWSDDIQSASLGFGYQWSRGSEDDFLSSGDDDYSLSVNYSHAQIFKSTLISFDGRLGYLKAGDIKWLAGQNQNLWFATAAFEWQFWQNTSAIFQLDAHRALADSSIDALGNDAAILSIGLNQTLNEQWKIGFSISEDVVIEAAADISFLIALEYRP